MRSFARTSLSCTSRKAYFPQAAGLMESLISRTKDPYSAVMRRLRLGDIHYRAGQRQKAVAVHVSTLSQAGHDTWLEREILAQIEQIFRVEDDLTGLKKQYADVDQSLSQADWLAAAAMPAVGRPGRT